eukprot:TRINITY_DN19197_c0_g1_i1.p2 TRINITY_DN19197_c0_g1~~TRINITY_DN19197_c0_g1_i1.p2  ORF type:complete len:169 (+),score=36.35 TRINITY_DN19197_c0_g1_i1:195-701(+)
MLRRCAPLFRAARKFRGYSDARRRPSQAMYGMTLSEACAVLGLQPGPSLTEKKVKDAGRELRFRYHPDKGGDEGKWLELQEALQVVRNLLDKGQAIDSKPVLDSFAKTRKARNEWANATYNMYRVTRWRAASAPAKHAMLGNHVQQGLLEDSSLDEFDDTADRDSRSR